MKKIKKLCIVTSLMMVCLFLVGCVKGKVTAYLDISTQTGAGEFAFDLFIRADDDTQGQLTNGIEGVMQSIQAFGVEKEIEFTLSQRKETVQKWDDNEDDDLPEDHEADVINIKFAFHSLEDLNEKMVTLSNNGEIATTKGFAEFIENTDGTTTFSYRNKAIEEVVLAVETHIHGDENAYNGSEEPDGLVDTDLFYVTVDDNSEEISLQAYAAFPNRHFEVVGTYVDESKIETATPEPTEEPSKETDKKDETGNGAESVAEKDSFKDGSVTSIAVIGAIVIVVGIIAAIVILQKKRNRK